MSGSVGVRVPIQADASGIISAIEAIRAAIQRSGQDAKTFADLDLSHPELAGMADDIQAVQRRMADLTKIGRGSLAADFRGVMGGRDAILDPLQWLDNAQRSYGADSAALHRHVGGVGRFITENTQFAPSRSPPLFNPPPSDPRLDANPPETRKKEEEGGGLLSSLLGGVKGGLGFFLAQAGLGSIAGLAGRAVGGAREELGQNDLLMRHTDGQDFDQLRDAVRGATTGLQLTYQEAQRLALSWAKLANDTSAGRITEGIRQSTQFARGYGLDAGATTNAFASSLYMGVDPKAMASEIADAVREGGMTGQAGEVMNAFVRATQQGIRQDPTNGHGAEFLSMYAGLNATGLPGFKGANAEALIGSINGAVTGGGAFGEASQVLTYRAFARAGIRNPYQIGYLQSGGMFEHINGRGTGPTIFQAELDEIKGEYRGQDPYALYQAVGNHFGINPRMARSLLENYQPEDVNRTGGKLSSLGIKLGSVDFSAFQDITRINNLQGGALGAYRDSMLLNRRDLSSSERSSLQGMSGEDLRNALIRTVAEHGMPQTDATRMTQSSADLSNALTGLGATLVPALNDLQGSVASLAAALVPGGTEIGNAWKAGADGDAGAAARLSTGWGRDIAGIIKSGKGIVGMTGGKLSADQEAEVRKSAIAKGVDPDWLVAMATQESGGHADAMSRAGAEGLMQIMPANFASLGITHPFDVHESAMGGAEMLRRYVKQFGGNYLAASAAYNAGPNGAGVQHYAATGDASQMPVETQRYVAGITARLDANNGHGQGGGQISIAPLRVVHETPSGAPINVQHLPVQWTPASPSGTSSAAYPAGQPRPTGGSPLDQGALAAHSAAILRGIARPRFSTPSQVDPSAPNSASGGPPV